MLLSPGAGGHSLAECSSITGWEDGNSVTLKEADSINLLPSTQTGSREIYKRTASPVRVTSLPYKTSGAFPIKVTPLLLQLLLKTNVPPTLLPL